MLGLMFLSDSLLDTSVNFGTLNRSCVCAQRHRHNFLALNLHINAHFFGSKHEIAFVLSPLVVGHNHALSLSDSLNGRKNRVPSERVAIFLIPSPLAFSLNILYILRALDVDERKTLRVATTRVRRKDIQTHRLGQSKGFAERNLSATNRNHTVTCFMRKVRRKFDVLLMLDVMKRRSSPTASKVDQRQQTTAGTDTSYCGIAASHRSPHHELSRPLPTTATLALWHRPRVFRQ